MRLFVFGPRMFGGFFRPGVSFRPPRRREGREQDTFVYVIAGDHGLTKIGISATPTERLATLQTGSPFHLRIAHIVAAGERAFDVEQRAHSILDNSRQSGEWFAVSPETATAAVYSAAARLGVRLPVLEKTAASEPRGGGAQAWLVGVIILVFWYVSEFYRG